MKSDRLTGRVGLVTGAGRMHGIGRAIAVRLAAEGAAVVVSAAPRDPATYPEAEREAGWRSALSVVEEIEAAGGAAIAIDCDVTDTSQVRAMFEEAENRLGVPDAVVNNAAVAAGNGDLPILDMDDDIWRRTIEININGMYNMCKAAGRAMRASGRSGGIVNVSSLAGRAGTPNFGAYCASKFAIIGLTQQLAGELAPLGIRVNCLCPGTIGTDLMFDNVRSIAAHGGATFETVLGSLAAMNPLGRIGRVEEQAATVAFLLSDDASYIVGQSINVCGGLRMN